MIVATFASVVAGTVLAAGYTPPEPGMPPDRETLATHWNCTVRGEDTACRLRDPGSLVFHGVQVESVEQAYRGGALVATTIRFRESAFQSVLSSLQATLGPGEDRSERLRTGMGATFTNSVRVWRFPREAWHLEQYGRNINTSALRRMTGDGLEELLRQREAATFKGIRDL